MKTLRFNKYQVKDYVKKGDSIVVIVNFRTILYNFIIKESDLSIDDIICLYSFDDGTHDLILIALDGKFVEFDIKKRIIKRGKTIDKYIDKEYPPITYINYKRFSCFVQLDGITTIVGMTGGGKTYSAIEMLPVYADYFDKIAYLNYELPVRDVIERLTDLYPLGATRDKVVDKLYIKEGIMTSLNLSDILMDLDVKHDDKVVFIIDNVDSVRGQERNVYEKQNEFLKELDVMAKEREWHVLALVQMVKDHNIDLFDEDGEVKNTTSVFIASGSSDLPKLSRTVLFTGYNGDIEEFKTKVLKRGTGKYHHEIERSELKNDYYAAK